MHGWALWFVNCVPTKEGPWDHDQMDHPAHSGVSRCKFRTCSPLVNEAFIASLFQLSTLPRSSMRCEYLVRVRGCDFKVITNRTAKVTEAISRPEISRFAWDMERFLRQRSFFNFMLKAPLYSFLLLSSDVSVSECARYQTKCVPNPLLGNLNKAMQIMHKWRGYLA